MTAERKTAEERQGSWESLDLCGGRRRGKGKYWDGPAAGLEMGFTAEQAPVSNVMHPNGTAEWGWFVGDFPLSPP